MRTKKYIFWLLCLFIPLLTAILLGELFLQLQKYNRLRYLAYRKYGFFEVDPFLQVRPKQNPRYPEQLYINNDSFRGDPVSDDPQTYRIFTLGGSTTYSQNLLYTDTYPARLEKKLKERYPDRKIQVENAACDWYTSEHSVIRYLFNVRYYKPDLIIIKHAVNDLFHSFIPEWWCRPGDTFRRDYSHYLGPVIGLEQVRTKYFPFTEFLLLQKIKDMFKKSANPYLSDLDTDNFDFGRARRELKPVSTREFKSLDTFEYNLKLLVKLLKADGVKVILLTEPSIYRKDLTDKEISQLRLGIYFGPVHCAQNGVYPDVESMGYGMHLYNSVTLKTAKELNVPCIDVDAAIPKEIGFFLDDVHPTASATEVESGLVFDLIVKSKLLEK